MKKTLLFIVVLLTPFIVLAFPKGDVDAAGLSQTGRDIAKNIVKSGKIK